MPEMLIPRSPLVSLMMPGRHGRPDSAAGVQVGERPCGLAKVLARRNRTGDLTAAVRRDYGIALPRGPQRAGGDDLAFVWSGPDQWLAVAGDRHRDLAGGLSADLADLAAVSDQSAGLIVLRIAGPRARDTLMKGALIDLDPRAFPAGTAAVTLISHIGVHLWCLDATPGYELAVPRSMAASFWHWLEESAAEFGLEVVAAAPMEEGAAVGGG